MNSISFSPEMLALVVDGKKTQTRRPMKTQLKHGNICGLFPSFYLPTSKTGGILWPNAKDEILAMNPYGAPGDRLMVRDSEVVLEIVRIDGQRLSSMDAEEMIAEGMSTNLREHDAVVSLQEQFCNLWDSFYGSLAAAANPWVWVVEFKLVTP